MIISTDTEKAFEKNQYLFMIKLPSKVRAERSLLNLNCVCVWKTPANLKAGGDTLIAFSVILWMNKGAITSIQDWTGWWNKAGKRNL